MIITIIITCYVIRKDIYIRPPHLRRYNSLMREWIKCVLNDMLPIHSVTLNIVRNQRLKSRKLTRCKH